MAAFSTIAAAALGAGASIYSANKSSKASKQAAQTVADASDKEIQLQREARDEARATLRPYVERGDQARGYLDKIYMPQAGAPAPQRRLNQLASQSYLSPPDASAGFGGAGPARMPFTPRRAFENLPPPGQFRGQGIRDRNTGQVMLSDGTRWNPAGGGGGYLS